MDSRGLQKDNHDGINILHCMSRDNKAGTRVVLYLSTLVPCTRRRLWIRNEDRARVLKYARLFEAGLRKSNFAFLCVCVLILNE